jgi:Uma2 family endonuclease
MEQPPMSAYATWIASLLVGYLKVFAENHQLGRAVAEMLFDFGMANLPNRRPDVAFVSFQRWPKNRRVPRTAAWNVVPELAIEVISETNLAEQILGKIREYFQAGVQLVWVVYPVEEQVYVYESLTQIRVLTRTDELDGGTVLPGFRLPLGSLFEEEAASE